MSAHEIRRDAFLALGVGAACFVLATVLESALIAVFRPGPWTLEWLSDLALSVALVVATFLWLRLKALHGRLTALERAQVAVDTELRLAAQIQRRFLDAVPPAPSWLRFHAVTEPAGRVGGDFYDIVDRPDGRALLLVADVAGKGVPAAITLASARAAFRMIARNTEDVAALTRRLSRWLYDEGAGSSYLTLLMCDLDPGANTVRYVNAGHPTGIILGAEGIGRLAPTGPPVGLLPSAAWDVTTLACAGMRLGLLVTDGVTEALEAGGDPEAALIALAGALDGAAPERVCAAILEGARAGTGRGVAPPDDRTVVAFSWLASTDTGS